MKRIWAYGNEKDFNVYLPNYETAPTKKAAIACVLAHCGGGWIAELEEVMLAPRFFPDIAVQGFVSRGMDEGGVNAEWRARVWKQISLRDLESELEPLFEQIRRKVAAAVAEAFLPLYRVLRTEEIRPKEVLH